MQKDAAIGSGCNLYRLIRSTGARKSSIGEVIKYPDGSLIHYRERRLDRQAEQIRKPALPWISHQFLKVNQCSGAGPPSEWEVVKELGFSKRQVRWIT